MKKIPRDLSGNDLVKYLKKLGYHSTRQVGSHIRLTTQWVRKTLFQEEIWNDRKRMFHKNWNSS